MLAGMMVPEVKRTKRMGMFLRTFAARPLPGAAAGAGLVERQPFHVLRRVGAAVLERNDVVDDVAVASIRITGLLLKLPLGRLPLFPPRAGFRRTRPDAAGGIARVSRRFLRRRFGRMRAMLLLARPGLTILRR